MSAKKRTATAMTLAVSLAAALPVMAADSPDEQHLERIRRKDMVNEAVDKGLAYLVSQQDPAQGCFRGDKPNTMTGLACMALMAAGHFPGRSPYGDNLRRGMLYLARATEKDKGFLGNEGNARMYGHGICSVALCEAYGMMRKEEDNLEIKKAVERALKVILDSQYKMEGNLRGGWRYEPQPTDADTSATAWQILALRSAQNCKLDVPKQAIEDALSYLRNSYAQERGFAYKNRLYESPATKSAGVVCMLALGANRSDRDKEMIETSAKFLLTFDFPEGGEHFYYNSYYEATAANMMGEKHRDALLPKMERTLMELQLPSGEFKRHRDREEGGVYSTAFGVICLCVGYQYLPIYQE
ncbi:MAG: terpene cyclase/mutase family protein [Verrucomicrobiota bacterium]|nr:terpene cyclase/mutase family protein [Verrucomicrobiota bacterium]